MALTLYYHPVSSFCQMVLIALYERNVPFEGRIIDLGDPAARAELASHWPLIKFPVLRDDARNISIPESTLIIAFLDEHHGSGPRLIPGEFDNALPVHILDRLIDNQLMISVTKIVTDSFRGEGRHDLDGVEQAKAAIVQAYALLEDRLPEDGWAARPEFSLADCGAAPALFYANTIVALAGHPRLAAYYRRLCGRTSVARVIEEARPYRTLYPLPWPPEYG